MKCIPTNRNGDDGPSIYINTSQGVNVGLNQRHELILFNQEQTCNLGITTQAEADELCSYIQRLKIHLK